MNFRVAVLGVLVGLSSSLAAQKITKEDAAIALQLLKVWDMDDKDTVFFVQNIMGKLVGKRGTQKEIEQCVAAVCAEVHKNSEVKKQRIFMEKMKMAARLTGTWTSTNTSHETYKRRLSDSEELLHKFDSKVQEIDTLIANLEKVRKVWPELVVALLHDIRQYKPKFRPG